MKFRTQGHLKDHIMRHLKKQVYKKRERTYSLESSKELTLQTNLNRVILILI